MKEVVLSDISLTFEHAGKLDFSIHYLNGRFPEGLNAIVGPSGSGKTTLLNLISGLIKPDSGKILFDGIPMDSNSNSFYGQIVSYMTVERNEIPSLSVFDNLRLVHDDKAEIDRALSEMGLQGVKESRVSKLSKGERARLSIARLILQHSELSLFDEPTANLDAESANKAFEMIKRNSIGNITILVTHDATLAHKYADHVFQMENGVLTADREISFQKDEEKFPRRVPIKITNAPLARLGFRKAFQKKIPAILSGVLLTVSFIFGFIGMANLFPKEKETFASGIDSLNGDAYLCSDSRMTREVSPHKHFRELNQTDAYGFNVFSLSFSGGYSIPVGIYEEAEPYVALKETPDSNKEAMVGHNNSAKEHFIPIALTTEQKDCFCELQGMEYKIGDILPLSFFDSSVFCTEKFVLSEVFEAKNENESQLPFADSYPAFVSQDSYLTHLKASGITDPDIEQSLIDEVQEYNDFIDSNGIAASLKYRGNVLFESKVTKASLLSDYFYNGDGSVPVKEGGFFLFGSLPKNENEIAVCNYQAYSLLGSNHNSATNGFFAKYPDGYPLKFLQEFPSGLSEGKFKIVGTYGYLMPSEDGTRFSSEDSLIISDALYDKVFEKISADYCLPGFPAGSNTCYSKGYLADNCGLISSKVIVPMSSKISSFSTLISNSGLMARFLSIVGLLLFIAGTLVVILYLANVSDKLKSDFAVMRLWGVNGKRFMYSYFSSSMVLLLPPLILSFALGYPLLSIIGSCEASALGFPGVLYFQFGWSFLVVFAFFAIIFALSFVPLLFPNRKGKLLEKIKNDQ